MTPKDDKGRRRHRYFQRLTSNVGYPKLREHLGSVVTLMKLSADWPDFKRKLDRLHPRRRRQPATAARRRARLVASATTGTTAHPLTLALAAEGVEHIHSSAAIVERRLNDSGHKTATSESSIANAARTARATSPSTADSAAPRVRPLPTSLPLSLSVATRAPPARGCSAQRRAGSAAEAVGSRQLPRVVLVEALERDVLESPAGHLRVVQQAHPPKPSPCPRRPSTRSPRSPVPAGVLVAAVQNSSGHGEGENNSRIHFPLRAPQRSKRARRDSAAVI